MITLQFKERIAYLNKNKLVFEALYEILDLFKLKHPSFIGFDFREELNPKGLLLTAEGTQSTGIQIKVPRNILDFDLALIANLLMHEMFHVYQRTGNNQIEKREEREWQAYYEMMFHEKFTAIPDLDDFYLKQFGKKALTYYERMDEMLQAKYAVEKIKVEKLILKIETGTADNSTPNEISWNDFEKINIRVGKIIHVSDFAEAKNPAYQLEIDFGPIGIKKSSAQITSLYAKQELIGKQIIAVINFAPKQIGSFISECLVLGVFGNDKDVILLNPDRKVENGTKIG